MTDYSDYATTLYTVPFSAFGVTSTGAATAYDLWSITATTLGRVVIEEINVGQLSTATAGNQQLNVTLFRGSTSIGGGSSVAPVNTKGWANAQVANTKVFAPSTNLGSTASATLLYADNTDFSGSWFYRPEDDEEFTLDTGQNFMFRISAPPSAAGTVSLSGTLVFREIGKNK